MRELREAAEQTQEELARRAKLSAKFISAIENGHTNPSIGVVARLCGGLEIPMSAFFAAEAPGPLLDDVAAIAALVGAQPAQARKRALRVLRALFDD